MVYQCVKRSHNHIHTEGQFRFTICPTKPDLDHGWKPECLEKTQAWKKRACKLHTNRSQARFEHYLAGKQECWPLHHHTATSLPSPLHLTGWWRGRAVKLWSKDRSFGSRLAHQCAKLSLSKTLSPTLLLVVVLRWSHHYCLNVCVGEWDCNCKMPSSKAVTRCTHIHHLHHLCMWYKEFTSW